MRKPMPLEPWLYLAVLALFAIDVLIVVLMSSGWSFSRRASASRCDAARRCPPDGAARRCGRADASARRSKGLLLPPNSSEDFRA